MKNNNKSIWVRATGFKRIFFEWEGEIPSDIPEKEMSKWVMKNADWQECQEQSSYIFIADEDIEVDVVEEIEEKEDE
tara:strand:- start:1121 stop:1351 length:231 start_codon:yes stop_codon:yes gene_type:complete